MYIVTINTSRRMDPRYTSTPFPMVQMLGADLPTGSTPGLSPVDRLAAPPPPDQYTSFASQILSNDYSVDDAILADNLFRIEGKYLSNISCTF